MAAYDDHGLLLLIRSRPEGPAAPMRITPGEALALSIGIAQACEAYNAHRGLIGGVEDALTNADDEEGGDQVQR